MSINCNKKDCLNNNNGMCMALNDTEFGDRQCSFYKTFNKKVNISERSLEKYNQARIFKKPTLNEI